MYAALIFAAQEKNKDSGKGLVYGASKKLRHQHHNRGSYERFPIAGGKGLFYEEGSMTKIGDRCENGFISFNKEGKKLIADRCRGVVIYLLQICEDSFKMMYDVVSGR